jgi:hypothetical protein
MSKRFTFNNRVSVLHEINRLKERIDVLELTITTMNAATQKQEKEMRENFKTLTVYFEELQKVSNKQEMVKEDYVLIEDPKATLKQSPQTGLSR